ncbi:MAG TPA: DNA polymerase III subunit beta [Desulfobacteraceae bacterium]|nr:DNA polymerase III subunit beta [Desulfobacteraceae bacterium]
MANQQTFPKSLTQFISILKAYMPELRKRYAVQSLGIFGSYLRNEQEQDSDLDILVELDNSSMSLVGYIELENFLSDMLGVKVDLAEQTALKPQIGQHILNHIVYI